MPLLARLELTLRGCGVTTESLAKGHLSVLRNPDIAHALYLRGLMEKAGRGSVLMIQQCRESRLPDPAWKSDPLGATVRFEAPQVTPQVERLVGVLNGPMTAAEIQAVMAIKDRVHFRNAYLKPSLATGAIEMTIPDKPNSSKQRYRLTALGDAVRGKSVR